MRRSRLPAVVLVALPAALLASGLVAAHALAAGSGISPVPPDGVSPNGQAIRDLYDKISWLAIPIFVGVEASLLYIIVRYRKSRLPADYVPPQWHGNPTLEVVWTVIPFVIVTAIAAGSFVVLQSDYTKRSDAETEMNVAISSHQFGWTYTYDNGVTVKSEGLQAAPLVLPTHKLVRLQIDSSDVVHSYWVPEIAGKTDAVPGYSNFTWMKLDHAGQWRGECAELCGAGHSTMQILVTGMDQPDFDAWVTEQKKAAASPSPSARPSGSPPASPSASPSAGASPRPSASGSPAASPSASASASPSPSPTRSP